MQKFLFVMLVLASSAPALSQSFSCYTGRPACLSYGDKICSSTGMCVSRNAICFDQYQCGYEGFTCKSNVTDCIDAHDTLLRKYNVLVDDYNENLKAAKKMASELSDIEFCLIYASNLEDAKRCAH